MRTCTQLNSWRGPRDLKKIIYRGFIGFGGRGFNTKHKVETLILQRTGNTSPAVVKVTVEF